MDYTILHKRFFNYRLAFLLSLLRSLVLLVLFFFLVSKVTRGKTKTDCVLTSLSEETEEALVLSSEHERQKYSVLRAAGLALLRKLRFKYV